MKRSLGALGIFVLAAAGSGCPIYSDNVISVECYYATDCPPGYRCSYGACVQAPPHVGPVRDGGSRDAVSDAPSDVSADGAADSSSEASTPDAPAGDADPVVYCGNPNDCAPGETCTADGTCRRGSCLEHACVNQYQCTVIPTGHACLRVNGRGCSADRHCFSNERCIDGACTAVGELCTDRSQCSSGKVCADGRCTLACTSDVECMPGFLCSTALGACTTKAQPCLQTKECGSQDRVCVDGACVPRCAASGACGVGMGPRGVCLDNGCVPSVKVAELCSGGPGQACGSGICLHQQCYNVCSNDVARDVVIPCGPDRPVCRSVTVAGTGYSVCVVPDAWGSECDLSAGKPCTDGKICIDGYCK